MKHINIIIIGCFVALLAGLSVFADEAYKSITYSSNTNYNIDRFASAYGSLNNFMDKNKTTGVKYNILINKFKNFYQTTNTNGVFIMPDRFEVKYSKLKDYCVPYPANKPALATSKACAKFVVDVDGFNSGSNKLIGNNNTVLVRDQFVLYLYSNVVRPKYLSPEDILLFNTKGKI